MPSQSAVSMNQIITVNGKVIRATSSGFIPQALILTQNPIMPTGTVLQFNSASEVLNYFGETYYNNAIYSDYDNSVAYFNGATKSVEPAGSVLFYYYPLTNTGAFTRGNALSALGTINDLTNLQTVTAGTLNLRFNGTNYLVTAIDLHTFNSFTAIATAIQTKIESVSGLSTVTCTWDSVTGAFTITLPYGSGANTVGYITNSTTTAGDNLAQYMKITQSAGATISQGIAAQTPAQVMDAVTNLSSNFATIICNFDINSDPTYTIAIGITAWNSSQDNLYLPLLYDINGGAQTPITSPMEMAVIAAGYGQSNVQPYTFNTNIMVIICNSSTVTLPFAVAGVVGAYNFNSNNGITQLNACSFSGITPVITNNKDYNLLVKKFGVNSYINLDTRNNNFQWFETGIIGGNYGWIDTIIGYMWLSDQIQVQIAGLFSTLNSIPYNNLSIINAVIDPIFKQGLLSGVVQKNIPISALQKQALIQQTGYDFTSILYNQGYYDPQIIASPTDIANRTLSNINAWYTYAGGPVTVTINLTTVV